MIKRMLSHCGDETYPSCVVATMDDMVQIQLFLKNAADFDATREVFFEYLKNWFPARMTSITEFLHVEILCQMTGITNNQKVEKTL